MILSGRTVMLFIVCCLSDSCHAKQQQLPGGSVTAYKSGDLILGALIGLHTSAGKATCGQFFPFGFQLAEVMILTVERINNDKSLLPNITLGYDIRDYCCDSGLAMKQAYALLKNASAPVRAIFGPAHSDVAVLVASLLQVFNVPGISSTATSTELSGPLYHSYFRTVPPDSQQAKAMADVIDHFGWSYVAAVADDDSYGRNGIAALERESFKRNTFCIAFAEFVKTYDYEIQIESIVKKIKAQRSIKVVILWNEAGVLEIILKEALKQKMKDRTWFFSDYIGTNIMEVFERYRDTVVGSMGVTPSFYPDPFYEEHLRHVTPLITRNSPNPWWDELWASLFGCVSRASSFEEKLCASNLTLTDQLIKKVLYSSYTAYTTDAVMAVAHALHNIYTCKRKGRCTETDTLFSPEQVSTFLRNVSFQGLTGRISFDENADPLKASYEIMNVQRSSNSESLLIANVGRWKDGVLYLNESTISWNPNNLRKSVPQSVCRNKCLPGTMQTTAVMCCWECIKCPAGTFSSRYGSANCTECPRGQRSSDHATRCVDLPLKNVVWSDSSAIICSVVAMLGVILSIVSMIVLVKYRHTPLIKGSSYELSTFLLILIASCFMLSVVYLARPSDVICRLVEFWRSVALTLCVSILLLKTLRLMSAFEITSLGKSLKIYFRNKHSQLFCVLLINATEICLVTAWLAVDPPYLYKDIGREENIFFVCRPYTTSDGQILKLVVVGYFFLVSIFCTYCAIRVRNLPENFNEARHLGFSMYILLLSWLTYNPVESALENWYVVIISSATLLLSSYGLLGCMFLPKLYVILFQPEKNTQENVRSSISNYTFSQTVTVSTTNLSPKPNVSVTPQLNK